MSHTLTGIIVNRVGGPLVSVYGYQPYVVLIPSVDAVYEDGELRIGGIQVALDAAGSFAAIIPDGDYRIQVTHLDPALRDKRTWTSIEFTVDSDTTLADAIAEAEEGGGGEEGDGGLEVVDHGDGTADVTATSPDDITDHNDGTADIDSSDITNNNDGTATIAA